MRAAEADVQLETLPRGGPGRQVLTLALPMLGEQFFSFLVGLVDTWLAGAISKEATAAVGTASYMGWFVSLIALLVGTGAAALVSRSLGARDVATARRVAHQALILALLMGVLIAVTIGLSAPWLSRWLCQTREAQALLESFLQVDAFGYTLYAVVLVCGGVMRAAGDTRTPMRIQIAVNVVNGVLAAGLVFGWFGFELGVFGIALATVIARSIGGLLMAGVLFAGLRGIRLSVRELTPDWATIGRMMRVGGPAGLDGAMMWGAQMVFIKIVAESARDEAATANFAAHMIAMRMEAISYLPAVAWATAAATLVGQYLGAGLPARAARAGHLAALQAAGLTTVIGALFYILADVIYESLSRDEAVVAVGVPAFRLLALVQPVLCMAIVYIGALRGAGDTRTTMIFAAVGSLALRLPIAYLGAIVLGGGLIGAWIGMWADNVAKFVMGAGRFLHGGWKRTRV